MEKDEMRRFSWTELFIVTGLCFFAFSAILEFLNHSHPHIFIWIGSISLLLGILNAGLIFISRELSKRNHKWFP